MDKTEGTPRWVKAVGVVTLVVVVLFVVVLVIRSPGGHGPSRHGQSGRDTSPGEVRGHVPPPPGIPEHGDQQP